MAQATLADLNICFLFAGNHHPAMKRIQPIRVAIGRRTIFNLMGPLANPAHVTRQLLGIARPDYAPVYAAAMESLGTTGAAVVSGEEGLDEISGAGPTVVMRVGDCDLPDRIVPEDAGLPRHPLADIRGGDPVFNAAALRRLLAGDTGAYRDAVILNAAAALVIAQAAPNVSEAAALAAEAIDAGRTAALLDAWIAYS
jgi:anthranilate phosphoribosyltransferase